MSTPTFLTWFVLVIVSDVHSQLLAFLCSDLETCTGKMQDGVNSSHQTAHTLPSSQMEHYLVLGPCGSLHHG